MLKKIRNFCILAHVDHGKSTLADRFLELTGTVKPQKMQPQFLDANPIARERGITIKLAPVRMKYQEYILNLIDTPGHLDFAYEVSRSLAACEGAILLVDATVGIQAQTLAYFEKAKKQNLSLIPVVNKIDMKLAQPEKTALSLMQNFGFKDEEIIFISAKTGEGVPELLEAVIKKIPPPGGNLESYLRALVFDSFYDPHKGIIVAIRVIDGEIKKGEKLKLMAKGIEFLPIEIGYFKPDLVPVDFLENGAVGYLATGLKGLELIRVGETVTEAKDLEKEKKIPLPGYQPPKPMIFMSLYPLDQNQFKNLEEALKKLKLNDASFSFQAESSLALGKGFRMGFLGPLQAEIIKERLEREFKLEVITTAPQVAYELRIKEKKIKIENISLMPKVYDEILEPQVEGIILTPPEYVGKIIKLCQEHRGEQLGWEYVGSQVKLTYKLPLSEIIVNFFEELKSLSSGYASFDYQLVGYQPFEAERLDIYVAGKMIEAFSQIVPKNKAYSKGKELVEKLAKVIPRQMFEFAIQAAIGSRVIAKVTKKAWRKDVTAKLYGGDQTRKDKLLEKQKKGKKRLKAVGQVFLPQEAFLAVFKR